MPTAKLPEKTALEVRREKLESLRIAEAAAADPAQKELSFFVVPQGCRECGKVIRPRQKNPLELNS
jgi:hypothetical protein